MRKIYLLLILISLGFSGFSQTAATYIFSRSTAPFVSIVGQSATVPIFSAASCSASPAGSYTASMCTDDGITSGLPIGFTFNFCGTNYTTFQGQANGFMGLGLTNYLNGNVGPSYLTVGNGYLMAFFGDLWGTCDTAYYLTTGTPGSRVLTLEYKNWNTYNNGSIPSSPPNSGLNFQIKLIEGTNQIQFCYGTYLIDPLPTGPAAIGIANTSSDYQTLPSTTATTTTTSFTTNLDIPANGTVLQWCPPTPAIGGGTAAVCAGATINLTDALAGGTWGSSNSAVATISTSGVVTTISGGTSTITYTAGCGTPVTKVITVNALPPVPNPSLPINPCASTTLTDAAGTGTWISGATGIATVVSGTGVVTGVAAGSAPITFTQTSTGCTSVTSVSVNPYPAITGTASLCAGTTTTLSNPVSGGLWSSQTASQATVGSTTGIVSGLNAGTPNITYTQGTCFVIKQLTVNTQPAAIGGGASSICQLATTTFTDVNGGGVWTSGNTAIATIGSTGTVTGVSGGTAPITYTLAGNCFVATSIGINGVAPIVGATSFCAGSTSSLTNATTPGTWSSSNPTVASIGTTSGVLTGLTNGTTNITYTATTTGCKAAAVASVSGSPNVYSMTGGGTYCSGTGGLHIGLNSSDFNVGYQLLKGTTPVGSPVISTSAGSTIDFGPIIGAGTYTVVGNYGSGCATTMAGSETIVVNALPISFAITGGGNYCLGGTGVHVGLSSSTPGITYQLFNGTSPIGGTVLGTSFPIDFGLVTISTTTATLNVVATNATTGCTNNMAGSAIIGVNALPTVFAVTGGGGYCLGGTGVHVGTNGSVAGTNYQLYNGTVPIGSALTGTGSPLDFGLTASSSGASTFTVIATATGTGCSASMSGTAVVTVNPLPTAYTVTGGGAYCSGGTGVTIGLNSSASGVNYQLFNGSSAVGSALPGTGVALSFGPITAPGSYTIQATNTSTDCIANMSGGASISLNPLPSSFTVTGGGPYCFGGSGVNVGLSGSVSGATYQLYNYSTLIGAASGTGAPINFGLQTALGAYTVVATNPAATGGCTGNMSGSVTVTINPLPTAFNITGGGAYCAGGAGSPVGLSGSTTGIKYQLFNGTAVVGSPVSGTNAAFSFGSETAAGAYSVVATNTTTGCTNNMTGSAIVSVTPLPTPYAMTGGGAYCAGGAGLHIGLAASGPTVTYSLNSSGTSVASLPGTGGALDFGAITVAGTYKVSAVDGVSGCTNNMSGSAVITITSLPTQFTASVANGGNYCAGGSGQVISLAGSVIGVNYQLFNGTTAIGSSLPGTGFGLNFGSQTAAGTYTIVATSSVTGCTSTMIGSPAITIIPLPAVYAVTGGGVNCVGGAGAMVGLSGSASGVNYQLFTGGTPGAIMAGTGSALSFGLEATAGTYTVVATNPLASCSSSMSGSATITTLTSALPALYPVTGGGSYCAGGAGIHVGLLSSAIGFTYQLLNGTALVGAPLSGTAAALDFGAQTANGTYTVVATNVSTGCNRVMTGSAIVSVNALPSTHTVTGGGNYCASGPGLAIGLNGSDVGVNYQLYQGTTPLGSAVPGTGAGFNFGTYTATGTYTIVASNTTNICTNNMTGSATIGTYPLPVVYNATGGGNYCTGAAGVHIGLSNSNMGINYQLYNYDTIPVGTPFTGTGVAIDFGLQTLAGPYLIVATDATTSCSNDMTGTPNVVMLSLPSAHTVTGGGGYCIGGTGVVIGLNGSDPSTNYQLFNGLTITGSPVHGTGSAISFGHQLAAGTYSVLATNTATTCAASMPDSVSVAINMLPTAYAVSGSGNYCSGGAGLAVSLSLSDPGILYQLYDGTTAVDSAVTGTGSMIVFENQTVAGTYTVVARNSGSTCTNNMTGSAVIVVNPLPTAYILSGGGNYCANTAGPHIILSGSNTGNKYQLYKDSVAVGGAILGTGLPLNFGSQAAAGNYTVIALHAATGCTNYMNGNIPVAINPLPGRYSIAGLGSNYCAGGVGIDILLSGSDAGINYQLYAGSTLVGSAMPGTGTLIDFGFKTVAGNYSINAMNTATGCVDTMNGITSITINAQPTVYSVTGGGSFCSGGTGVNIGLSNSTTGIAYQLTNSSGPVGAAVTGTGAAITFGAQTAGGSYTVVATNPATTCTDNMSGSAIVAVNASPIAYPLTGGGSYCASGAGVPVGVSTSSVGYTYQLMNGTTLVGSPVAGTGSAIGFGLQTGAGTYTVMATSTSTACSGSMGSSVNITITPLPATHTVTGGGNYCPGGSGVIIGVASTNAGVSYQLYNGTAPAGGSILGSGPAISFPLVTATGSYTVVATDGVTGCTNTMSGSAVVNISAAPAAFTVTGGGNFCVGSAGVDIGLSGSSATVNYTIYNGTSAVVTIAGTGSPLDLGLHAGGTYTVKGTDATTGCTTTMTGSVTNTPIPSVVPSVVLSATHGDTLCSGVVATFNAAPSNGGTAPTYFWMVNGVSVGSASSYSYTPSNGDIISVTLTSSAACASPLSATAHTALTVFTSEMPAVNVSANPGVDVCQGTMVTYTATPTNGGSAPMYSWVIGGAGGFLTSSSTYSFVPVNGETVSAQMVSSYQCSLAASVSSNVITMEVDSAQVPVVTITASPSAHIAPGEIVELTATATHAGPSPSYQWYVNGILVTGATTPMFVKGNYSNLDSVTCTVLSSGPCPDLSGFNSVIIYVRNVGVQQLSANSGNITLVPNPNKGAFVVKGSLGTTTDNDVTIEVTDMLGHVVYNNKVTATNGVLNEQIQLNGNLANGMYLLNLRTGSENIMFHLVIEQ